MNGNYLLDKDNAKLLGVCAGLAKWSGADRTGIRLIAVVLALLAGPVAIALYLLAAFVAPRG